MAKKVSLYGILSALCIVIGYIEHFISFDFLAPGIKIGLANAVALLLLAFGDVKGAFLVNIVRILLSALLFSTPQTLIYSLSAGFTSLVVMSVISKTFKASHFSLIGFSIIGALVHNMTQLICALLMLGRGVLYYSPFLIISALLSGIITGSISNIIFKRIKK